MEIFIVLAGMLASKVEVQHMPLHICKKKVLACHEEMVVCNPIFVEKRILFSSWANVDQVTINSIIRVLYHSAWTSLLLHLRVLLQHC